MADLITPRGTTPDARFHDEGDGSYDLADAAHLRGWTGTIWARVGADANGNLTIAPGGAFAGMKYKAVSVAGAGDNEIVAAVAAKKIKVVSYSLVVAAAVTCRWYSGAVGTALSGAMSFAANGGIAVAGTVEAPLFETGVNTALVLNLGGAQQTSGHLAYIEEA